MVGQISGGTDPTVTRKVNRQAHPPSRRYLRNSSSCRTGTRPSGRSRKRPKRTTGCSSTAIWRTGTIGSSRASSGRKLEKLHNRLAGTSGRYTAKRVLSLIKALFDTAIELGYLCENPAAGIRQFEEETRERFLTAEELPRFFEAVGGRAI